MKKIEAGILIFFLILASIAFLYLGLWLVFTDWGGPLWVHVRNVIFGLIAIAGCIFCAAIAVVGINEEFRK